MGSQSLLQQAIALHRGGNFAEAEVIYQRILAVQPSNIDALQMLGVLASQTGRFAVAEDLCKGPPSWRLKLPEFTTTWVWHC